MPKGVCNLVGGKKSGWETRETAQPSHFLVLFESRSNGESGEAGRIESFKARLVGGRGGGGMAAAVRRLYPPSVECSLPARLIPRRALTIKPHGLTSTIGLRASRRAISSHPIPRGAIRSKFRIVSKGM